jgi:tryptophan synthase alpha chain
MTKKILLSERFAQAQSQKEKLFIPFITGGDPSLRGTEELLKSLEKSGAGIIELGVPFSDPIADGPTIQRASERALKQKASLGKILDLVKKMRKQKTLTIPLVIFSYFNPIYKMGLESFFKKANEAGVSGVLCVDLPPEEAKDYCAAAEACQIETIFLASPTTSEERLRLIDSLSTGFVYYVSRLGVTGTQKNLSKTLESEVNRIKSFIKRPIAVGFGISTPEQAKKVARLADAVVVGSAMVALVEKNRDHRKASKALASLTKKIHKAIN